MQPSFVGVIVCMVILIVGRRAGNTLVVSMIVSMAFGSTAIVTLTALGGSSPLIETVFTLAMICALLFRRHPWRDLGVVFSASYTYWLVLLLFAYVIIGSWLFPRLFFGQATVFIPSPARTGVIEVALAPSSGNITQCGYFVLNGLASISLASILVSGKKFSSVANGYFIYCIVLLSAGLIDLLSKLAGAGDVLAFLRTANYAMLTNVQEGGFYRISGLYSEASAFGGSALAGLAFSFTYWRYTGNKLSIAIWSILLVLIVVSTSSTAYFGLAVLASLTMVGLAWTVTHDGFRRQDVLLLTIGIVALLIALAFVLLNPTLFDPLVQLFDSMVLNKSSSASGKERAYWNVMSLQSFFQTNGMGVGIGSSRASSWAVAVISQLGFFGALLLTLLAATIIRGVGPRLGAWLDPETIAITASVRAAAIASMISGSLASGTADPGLRFFIALAVVHAARATALHRREADEGNGGVHAPLFVGMSAVGQGNRGRAALRSSGRRLASGH